MMTKRFDKCIVLMLLAEIGLGLWVIWLGESLCLSKGMAYADYASLKLQLLGISMIGSTIGTSLFINKKPKQRLLMIFPVPTRLPVATALVLLNDGDGKVYRYVMAHGGQKIIEHTYADREAVETRVTYLGKPIYSLYYRRFSIDGWNYHSKTITTYVQPA